MRTLLLALTLAPLAGASASEDSDEPGFTWDRRAVEHVWNRAGFGVREEDVDRWLQAGPEALVDHLLAPRPLAGQDLAPKFVALDPWVEGKAYRQMTQEEKREARRQRNRQRTQQFKAFRADWVRRMMDGEDPLRDRMTLFWHGVFTSSYETVKRPDAIVAQHDTLRAGALGSYADLLRAMLRDPAMLVYLDNDENRKGRPNENLAREVMELFSLGEGNYTEDDVREAARALTGAGVKNSALGAMYQFNRKRHDGGEKEILGVRGAHGPQDLARILLDRPECAEFVARSVIEYLEGAPAATDRVEAYAAMLRATGYDVGGLLRRLLLDPAFYRDEVVGARVASPVDFVVGTVVRLDLELPDEFVVDATAALGQDLFRPPNVKGWDEGMAWITTSTFMMRGNVAGAMLGLVDQGTIRSDARGLVNELASAGEMDGMSRAAMKEAGRQQMRRDEIARLTQVLKRAKYEPDTRMAGALVRAGTTTDAEAVAVLTDELLAIEPPAETLRMLTGRLTELREDFEVEEDELARSRRRSEHVLRRLAHQILSLPEAQLH